MKPPVLSPSPPKLFGDGNALNVVTELGSAPGPQGHVPLDEHFGSIAPRSSLGLAFGHLLLEIEIALQSATTLPDASMYFKFPSRNDCVGTV